MNKYFSMAALALVGAMMTGCSGSDDDGIADTTTQQTESTSKTVRLTTTVSMDGGAQTRALTIDDETHKGVKTFAKDEKMAIVYKNKSGQTVKVVSEALKDDGDIAEGAKSATFTFELEDPNTSEAVTYIYPAAMAKADGSVNYGALATQDGTLATLSSSLDLATYSAAWEGTSLPAATLENQLAILACTIKNSKGIDITGKITGMTVSAGSNSYTVSRSADAGPIYVAILPTASAEINITATDGTLEYSKTLATTKTYKANNGYNVSWKMGLPVLDISTVSVSYTVTEDMVLTGEDIVNISTDKGGPYEITLDNVNGIDIEANTSIDLKLNGESRLRHIYCDGYVTIDDAGYGDGTLIVIDDGTPLFGNYIINGGTVKAKANWEGSLAILGYLTVNGGNVYIAGGDGQQAVDSGIDGEATWYGWDGRGWNGFGGPMSQSQYITTDGSDENDPADWNW